MGSSLMHRLSIITSILDIQNKLVAMKLLRFFLLLLRKKLSHFDSFYHTHRAYE